MDADIEVVMEGYDPRSIDSMLRKIGEVIKIKMKLQAIEDDIKLNILKYLKERHWKQYIEKQTKVSASIVTVQKEIIDKGQLKINVRPDVYESIVRFTPVERLDIITPEMRKKLKNIVNPRI